MKFAQPLPTDIADRYKGWRDAGYAPRQAQYETLADEGQTPSALVIGCVDSRVQIEGLLGAEPGDFFVHRNIANLVPPFVPGGSYQGTPAAVQFAVAVMGVSRVIVVGHSQCGGVKGCHDMCSGAAPALEAEDSFVGRWVDILRPGYERVAAAGGDADAQLKALEAQAVIVSLENLMTYPFVAEKVEAGTLTLHGLSINIRSGELTQYDAESGAFQAV